MGIHDRDYIRGSSTYDLSTWARTCVGALILTNVAIWLLQVIFREVSSFDLTVDVLACSADDIFGGGIPQVWRLVTANFAHSVSSPWHIVFNMLGLWIFGRELERIYGVKDFLFLYIVAGATGVFFEVLSLHFQAKNELAFLATTPVLGASAAVMAIVVAFTMFYPRKPITVLFVQVPAWLLCVFFIGNDLLGWTSPGPTGTAHVAHLTGALFGFLFWRFDWRWTSLWSGGRGRSVPGTARKPGSSRRASRTRRRTRAEREESRERRAFRVIEGSVPPTYPPPEEAEVPDELTERVDQLLAKISEEGLESLTEEERQFLEDSARKYRGR